VENCGNHRRKLRARRNQERCSDGPALGIRRERFVVMRTCSACAGDYEDPDRTAALPGDLDDDGDHGGGASTAEEEFHAEE